MENECHLIPLKIIYLVLCFISKNLHLYNHLQLSYSLIQI